MSAEALNALASEVFRAGEFDVAVEVQALAERAAPGGEPGEALAAADDAAARALAGVVGRRERSAWEAATLAMVRAGDVEGVAALGDLMRQRAGAITSSR